MAIYRTYEKTGDRSASDRLRHRKEVKKAIKNNVADIIANESIIASDGKKTIRVPIKSIKEWGFIFGNDSPGVIQGDENTKPGDIIGKKKDGIPSRKGQEGGNAPGIDHYETEIILDDLMDLVFEDLDLPEIAKKKLRELEYERETKRKGYRKKGIRPRLSIKKTVIEYIRRKQAAKRLTKEKHSGEDNEDFPFREQDKRYHYVTEEIKKDSNAVIICMMDTSGSMDEFKKYIARIFFFLLVRFVKRKYRNTRIVFIAHHTEAKVVTEEEFFHKGESGGTLISAALDKALEVIYKQHHPTLWNIYAFHISDGENFSRDNDDAVRAMRELCKISNLVGYGEIKSGEYSSWSSMIELYDNAIQQDNFRIIRIKRKEDVWPSFEKLLKAERGGVLND